MWRIPFKYAEVLYSSGVVRLIDRQVHFVCGYS